MSAYEHDFMMSWLEIDKDTSIEGHHVILSTTCSRWNSESAACAVQEISGQWPALMWHYLLLNDNH